MKIKFDEMPEQELLEFVVDPLVPMPWWGCAVLGMALALVLLGKSVPALLLMVAVFHIRQGQKSSALTELVRRIDRMDPRFEAGASAVSHN